MTSGKEAIITLLEELITLDKTSGVNLVELEELLKSYRAGNITVSDVAQGIHGYYISIRVWHS
jgi:hypothetical protein